MLDRLDGVVGFFSAVRTVWSFGDSIFMLSWLSGGLLLNGGIHGSGGS